MSFTTQAYNVTEGAIYLGTSVAFHAANVTDDNGIPINSPFSATITLQKPDDSTAFTDSTIGAGHIINDGNGYYHYNYLFNTQDQIGTWSVLWTIVSADQSSTVGGTSLLNVSDFAGAPGVPLPVRGYPVFAVFSVVATDPASPFNGQTWYNSVQNQLKLFNGTSTIILYGTTNENTFAPADPVAGNNSTTNYKMMGIGSTCQMTSKWGGKFAIAFECHGTQTVSGDGGRLKLAVGTGTVPTNGDAATGTALAFPAQGYWDVTLAPSSAEIPIPAFALTSATVAGQTYWFDAQILATTGGAFAIDDITINIREVKAS